MSTRDNHPPRWYEFSALVAAELVAIGKPRGIRQKEIAAAMGISEATMSLYVSGKRGILTTGNLIAACDLLAVSPHDVVAVAYAKLDRPDSGGATITPIRPRGPMSDDDAMLSERLAARTDHDDDEAEAQQIDP